jgi:hypothetical protein
MSLPPIAGAIESAPHRHGPPHCPFIHRFIHPFIHPFFRALLGERFCSRFCGHFFGRLNKVLHARFSTKIGFAASPV